MASGLPMHTSLTNEVAPTRWCRTSFQTRRQKKPKAFQEPRLLQDVRRLLKKVDVSGYRPTEMQ
eukprot:6818088-Pyramimonas_sp.AAC.1